MFVDTELNQELASARNVLSQLNNLLGHILDASDSLSQGQASLRSEWILQRGRAVALLAEINHSHQRIVVRLTSLNLYDHWSCTKYTSTTRHE